MEASLPAKINTSDPIALRYLMTETIFDVAHNAINAVEPPAREAEFLGEPKQVPRFSFCGQNQRNYLFLTQDRQNEWMSGTAMDAFIKTLAALKLTMDDVAVLNLARLTEAPSVGDLSLFFKPKVVVSLGASLVWPEQQGIIVFPTHSFDEMLTDAEKKRVFWTTIKTLLV
ncbi:hypothetical protein [Parapedobacter pyrenivorans]|uniref:hypothetical protein n=1 Tax=Parapedobacter pyrenivorans TaxID=1305674 RepID=UPI00333F5DC2